MMHELKTWPAYFDAIQRGDKTFEVRLNDRLFQKGDTVEFQRTDPMSIHTVPKKADGRPVQWLRKQITWVMHGGQFGIDPGFVVFSLGDCSRD